MIRPSLLAACALTGASAWLQLPFGRENIPFLSGHSDKPADAAPKKPLVDSEQLQSLIGSAALLKHANALYDIAELGEEEYGHPTRVIGSEGHEGTLTYITSVLASLGDYYTVKTQLFPAVVGNVFEFRLVLGDTVPKTASALSLTPPTKDNEPVHGDVALVKNEGCDTSDYPEEVKGKIALILRGGCPFGDKSVNAGKAGAIAAVVYNYDDEEVHGTLGTPSPDHVPTFGVGGSDAAPFVKKLKNGDKVDAIAYIDAEVKTIMTDNVVAQTQGGDQDNCVMLGAHSDSVPEGPGINDDGSGSMSLLEVAVRLSMFSVNNCVRFAWWAGEEEGLLGSDYYNSVLSEEENLKIRMFMDYDMMGSPNYAYQIYNATDAENPKGSEQLKQLYVDWYEEHGLNYTFIPFDGRSDYDGFIRNSIPGGGIATGAEGIKTEEEEEQFGGHAGDWYDPCYHQLCDDVSNVDLTAWTINTKLIAHSVATYANSLKGFPERTIDAAVETFSSKPRTAKYHGHKLAM